MRGIKTLLWMVLFLIVLFFSFQNQERVVLHFVFLPIENYQWFQISPLSLPLFLVILCSIFLGILIGGIGGWYHRFQVKRTLRENQKTIERLEKEIQHLRDSSLGQPSFLKKEG